MGYTTFTNGTTTLNDTKLNEMQVELMKLVFPIGSTYITQEDINPSTILNFGIWERLKGKVCLGLDEDDTNLSTIGNTGGEKEHTLTIDEIPSHGHSYMTTSNGHPVSDFDEGVGLIRGKSSHDVLKSTKSTGGGNKHNNMQPYEVVGYMWIRRS